MNPGPEDRRHRHRRVECKDIKPPATPDELVVLMAALEQALATEAKEIPASGWSSPQYRDGSSLRPGMRVWTAGAESDAPKQPGFPYPVRRTPARP
ncbi:hypothetical protein BH23ACT12_BH23ACT12_00300 [soil metagenome]